MADLSAGIGSTSAVERRCWWERGVSPLTSRGGLKELRPGEVGQQVVVAEG